MMNITKTKNKRNNEVRNLIKQSGFAQWEIAEALGVAEFTFSRRMRKEFTEEEIAEVKAAIERLKSAECAENAEHKKEEENQ